MILAKLYSLRPLMLLLASGLVACSGFGKGAKKGASAAFPPASVAPASRPATTDAEPTLDAGVAPSRPSDGGAAADDAAPPVEKMPPPEEQRFHGKSPYEVHRLNKRITLPYPLENIVRGLGKCRRGRRHHIAIDIGGVGKHWGLGTPVRAMAKAQVIRIGRAGEDVEKFGRLDRRGGTIVRRKRELPRSLEVPGYGVVHFFTRNYGSWGSGNIVSTRGLEGRLKGHRIRYMHLGAIHPDLKPGDIVLPGQEIGLMGCTAILNDLPHVHLDVQSPRGRRVDPSPILGLAKRRVSCPRSKMSRKRWRKLQRLAKKRRATRLKKARVKRLKKMRRAGRHKAKLERLKAKKKPKRSKKMKKRRRRSRR